MWKYLFFGLLAFNVYRYFFPLTTYDICMTVQGKTGVFCIPQPFKESESNAMMSIARSRVSDSSKVNLSVVMVTASPTELAYLLEPENMKQRMIETFR